ncbi:MAG: glycerol-3-phosphate dehydrogenase/oxidase [Chloroflexota bacterium]
MKRDLRELSSRQFDVVVIGGGIHGALTAWDATLRGLSVALIERGDFGGATSQNSLKIIHGGLRYLQDGNLARIRTMARERTTWMKIAPHLIHPLPCLTPTYPKLTRSQLAMKVALTLNDLISFDRNQLIDPEKFLPAGAIISSEECVQLLPGIDSNGMTGAAVWHDAQVYNSERLLLEFIISTAGTGATMANYVEATGLIQHENTVIGVRARDNLSGQIFDIQSKMVINCAGAWIDCLLESTGKMTKPRFAASVAMNLITDQVWKGHAAGLPSQPARRRGRNKDKRSQLLFIVPWRDKSMIGTWHIPWPSQSPDAFQVTDEIVQEFIDEVNSADPSLELTLDNIQHVNWGFLPVESRAGKNDLLKLVRDGQVINHLKEDGIQGLISLVAVKFTTARVMAEKAVNLAVKQLNLIGMPCRTHLTPIRGGQIENFNKFLKGAFDKAPRGLSPEIIKHLAYTYGSEYESILNYMTNQPELGETVAEDSPVIKAEIVHAVRCEMAQTLRDVIQRRTELGATGLPSMTTLRNCASLMGSELGWSIERQHQEIDSVIQAYPFKPMERVTA